MAGTRLLACSLALIGLLGCKDDQQGACLYPTAHSYSPGAPGSERLTATVILPDGQEHSTTAVFSASRAIDGGYQGGTTALAGTISGQVIASSADQVVIDACDASTGCQPALYRLAVTAPGLALAIPAGRAVTATWSFSAGPRVSAQRVAILDGGATTPNDGSSRLWLWAADPDNGGDVAGLFRVETQALQCNPSPQTTHGCGGGFAAPDDYAFRFSASSGGSVVTLATGATGTLVVNTLAGQQQHLTVHNLRSYQTELCDDYWNWAWWAAGRPGATGEPE